MNECVYTKKNTTPQTPFLRGTSGTLGCAGAHNATMIVDGHIGDVGGYRVGCVALQRYHTRTITTHPAAGGILRVHYVHTRSERTIRFHPHTSARITLR